MIGLTLKEALCEVYISKLLQLLQCNIERSSFYVKNENVLSQTVRSSFTFQKLTLEFSHFMHCIF